MHRIHSIGKSIVTTLRGLSLACVFAGSILATGCQKDIPPVEPPVLSSTPRVTMESAAYFSKYMRPQDQGMQSWRELAPSIAKSLVYVEKKNPEDTAISRPGLTLTWGQMAKTLRTLQDLLPRLDSNPELFLQHFTWVPVQNGIMYSGYYEPVLNASRTYKPGYYPLYKRPPELSRYRNKRQRYHSRADIDSKNVLAGRGLEIAWADSLVDIYYLQIQGSGKLAFDDGTHTYVNYSGQNGHKYVASGRIMREMNLIKKGDIFDQRQWFKDNPERISEILELNPSYVFFRLNEHGSRGAMGQTVDSWRSLATDRKFIPLGSVLAYGVNVPHMSKGEVPLRGIGFAQDVGGAIKNNRIDVFCGGGEDANYAASFLDTKGPAWVLVAK